MADMSAMSVNANERVRSARKLHGWLAVALIIVGIASLTIGATGVSLWTVLGKLLSGEALTPTERAVMINIRMPRLAMGCLVGAALAVSGTVMQGLFRNPLADPGIAGVSAGATFGAVNAIVLGGLLPASVFAVVGAQLVPIAAFLGAWVTTLLLYRVATRHGRTSVATMLLAGIALSALTMAFSGILIFSADDQQLRDLTFWGLGSLAGASWSKLAITTPVILLAIAAACLLGKSLNGIALGEATAAHIGIPVQKVKNAAILTVAGATGCAVAVSGGIGFIGIVVPHLLRLSTGPDHRPLLINAALLGAILLVLADVVARNVIPPAELPIGIITAVLGAPVFLWILLRHRGLVDL
ncbi:MAG: iron ABC transporter permease [Pseudomonadota bacterium]